LVTREGGNSEWPSGAVESFKKDWRRKKRNRVWKKGAGVKKVWGWSGGHGRFASPLFRKRVGACDEKGDFQRGEKGTTHHRPA